MKQKLPARLEAALVTVGCFLSGTTIPKPGTEFYRLCATVMLTTWGAIR